MTKVYLVMIGNHDGDRLLTPAYFKLEDAKYRWQEEKDREKKRWKRYIENEETVLMDIAKEQIIKLDKNTDPFDQFYCSPHDTIFIQEVEVV